MGFLLDPVRPSKKPLLQVCQLFVSTFCIGFLGLGTPFLLSRTRRWGRTVSTVQEPGITMVSSFQGGPSGFRTLHPRRIFLAASQRRPILRSSATVANDDFEFQFDIEAEDVPKVVREPPPEMKVRLVPRLDTTLDDIEPSKGATILPMIVLDQMHLPYSAPKLEVLEPRYRTMYDDILTSGARQFLVCNLDRETRRFAEVGSMVQVDDLQNVTDRRHGIKYVGKHSVIGRAKVVKVLNPKAAETEDTYLRAELILLEDSDLEEDKAEAEQRVHRAFAKLVDMQTKMAEMPRFPEGMASEIPFGRGTSLKEPGLWGAIALWQEFVKLRDTETIQNMKRQVLEKVDEFLDSNPSPEVRKSLLFYTRAEQYLSVLAELPEPLATNLGHLKRRFRQDVDAMRLGNDPRFQSMLQSRSYGERLSIFRHVLKEECRRLEARAALKAVLGSDNNSTRI